MFEAKAEAEAKAVRPRPRPRPKFWPRGHFGLEDLTSLLSGTVERSHVVNGMPVLPACSAPVLALPTAGG